MSLVKHELMEPGLVTVKHTHSHTHAHTHSESHIHRGYVNSHTFNIENKICKFSFNYSKIIMK